MAGAFAGRRLIWRAVRVLGALAWLTLVLLGALGSAGSAAAAEARGLQRVRLQLKWHHQFQFAGYYAAQVKGFYREEGLEVQILEGGPKKDSIDAVLEGKAEYGVADADLLTAYLEGKPVVALATIFQHSPYILLFRADSGIHTPSDLRGQTIMLEGGQATAQVKAIFRREGIPFSAVRTVPFTADVRDLIRGKVKAMSAYSTVEPYKLRSHNVEPGMIRGVDYGVDFYGDAMFTTRDEVKRHPERVAAFRRASLKGWDYAMAHPQEMVELIARMPGVAERGVTRGQLQYEAAEMRELMLPGVIEIGHMNPGRWEAMARTYASLGMVSKVPPDLDAFLYDPNAVPPNHWLLPTLLASGALALAGLLSLVWIFQLRRVVARRTRELGERSRQLAEANQAKDHFLAVLSHELRTPLTPVLTTVQLLQEKPELVPNRAEAYDLVRRNVELEARLIDDLLDVTRIARGKIELDKRATCLRAILNRAVEVCRPEIEAKGLEFGLDVPAGAYWVNADEARLQQVFWNLLKNAIKFTPPMGCVGIRCRRDETGGNREGGDGGYVVTEVNDSGVGIEPEALGAVFNPFEQGGVGTTRQFGGLGLGLTITKALVEMHGGSVEAWSAGKGKGASFRVRLPLVAPPAPAAEGAAPAPEAKEARKEMLRILLVEDHEDTARVMQRLLKGYGHEVELAPDVATALKMAGAKRFDLILSDLGLPDGSGVDLMKELRRRGQATPGIALSGYGQEEDIRRSREAGFAAHLTKPTRPERLAEVIAAVTAG